MGGHLPGGYEAVWHRYYQAWDELFAKKLEEFGEHEMARLFRTERKRFEQLTEAGRQYFYGPEDPEEEASVLWVKRLVEAAAEHVTADSAMGPLGYSSPTSPANSCHRCITTPMYSALPSDRRSRLSDRSWVPPRTIRENLPPASSRFA